MKLKKDITSREVRAFEAEFYGTKDSPKDRPDQPGAYNEYVVRAALVSNWFTDSFDPELQAGSKVADLRKEIERRYQNEVGISDEAIEAEKNS